jgi:hypothetical protein
LVLVEQEEHHHLVILVTSGVTVQTPAYFLHHRGQVLSLGHLVAAQVLVDLLQVLDNLVVLVGVVIVRVQQQEKEYILVLLS